MAIALKRLVKRVAATACTMAVAMMFAGESAQANPLVNLTIQARKAGTSDSFVTNLTVTPGESVEYRVIGQLATIGTTNSTFGDQITSLTPGNTTTGGGDGITTISYNLTAAGALNATIGSSALSTTPQNWAASSGNTGGVVAGNGRSVQGVTGLAGLGTNSAIFYGATTPTVISTGTIAIPSTGVVNNQVATITGSFGGNDGSFQFNAVSASGANPDFGVATFNSESETGTDPFVGYTPLSLTASVPEPASLSLVGIGAMALLRRRRQAARA